MQQRYVFLLRNLLNGILWFAAIVIAFLLLKDNINPEIYQRYEHLLSNNFLVYFIYTLSEIFFGIFPPEIFMFWGLSKNSDLIYWSIVFTLSMISYGAGWLNYGVGRLLYTTKYFRFFKRRYLSKTDQLLGKFGGFLIIVAALTPVPFGAVCMLVGSVKFSKQKFASFSLFRFLRYGLYAFIIWQTVSL